MAPKRSQSSKNDDSPFGEASRMRVIGKYFAAADPVTASNAWEHVYHLLLSMERRTKLAHVYDANHMQPGRVWHERAARFTDLLCKHWGIGAAALPDRIDVLFRECVEEYLAAKSARAASAAKAALSKAVEQAPDSELAEDTISPLVLAVTDLLVSKLGVADSPALADVVAEIERLAEHHFTIGNMRQNVRGEGFEDTLRWLFVNVARVPPGQIRTRTRAPELPGFKPDLPSAGKRKPKAPSPDLAFISADGAVTVWVVTAKWSTRQDRSDQFGQESAYYAANLIQTPKIDFVLITNEMDIARLRGVLAPPEGGGGFHFKRVYHVNRDLLERTQGEKFASLAVYVADRRFLSLEDLLNDAAAQFGHAATRRSP